MKYYDDFYFKYDVLLLSDVFEKFRNRYLQNYGLCLSHYFSEPVFSQDAMLSMTKFFWKNMTGDIFYFYKRYSKANSKYLTPCDHQ